MVFVLYTFVVKVTYSLKGRATVDTNQWKFSLEFEGVELNSIVDLSLVHFSRCSLSSLA